jgi:hypothetical protein
MNAIPQISRSARPLQQLHGSFLPRSADARMCAACSVDLGYRGPVLSWRPKMLRKLLVTSAALTAMAFSLPLAVAASAAPHTSTAHSAASFTREIAITERSCAVINIHLNGSHHSISCEVPRANRAGVKLDTYRDGCTLGGELNNLSIWNYDNSAELCFDGNGYIGVGIYNVNSVNNFSIYDTWIRYYNPTGHFCTLPGAIFPFQDNYINFGDPSSVKVTQIDIGADNGPNC